MFSLNSKKVNANLHLVDAQEVDLLQSINQFPSAIKTIDLIVPVLIISVTAIMIVIVMTLSLCVKSRSTFLQAHPNQGFILIYRNLPVFIANFST